MGSGQRSSSGLGQNSREIQRGQYGSVRQSSLSSRSEQQPVVAGSNADRQGNRTERQAERTASQGERQGERSGRQEERQTGRTEKQDERTATREERLKVLKNCMSNRGYKVLN